MASITVNSGSLNLSGSGVVAASGIVAPPNGPAHIVLATGTGKRFLAEFAGLAVADAAQFSAGDAVSITNNGDGTTTLSK